MLGRITLMGLCALAACAAPGAVAGPPVPTPDGAVGVSALLEALSAAQFTGPSKLMRHYGGLLLCPEAEGYLDHAADRLEGTRAGRILAWLARKTGSGIERLCPSPLGQYDFPGQAHRYLYSPVWGWLDFRHFSAGGYLAGKLSARAAISLGEEYEEHEDGDGDSSSYFSYEDILSNLMGACFAGYSAQAAGQGASFGEALESYLRGLHFVEKPLVEAPNGAHPEVNPFGPVRDYHPRFTRSSALTSAEDLYLDGCRAHYRP